MTNVRGFSLRLQEGDWVTGTSVNDERFRGYVEAVNRTEGTIQVYVVESDRQEIIGRTVETFAARTKRLASELYEEDLRGMIDLALMQKDKAWFVELGDALSEARRKAGRALPAGSGNMPSNRL